jgi:hypothetical protein
VAWDQGESSSGRNCWGWETWPCRDHQWGPQQWWGARQCLWGHWSFHLWLEGGPQASKLPFHGGVLPDGQTSRLPPPTIPATRIKTCPGATDPEKTFLIILTFQSVQLNCFHCGIFFPYFVCLRQGLTYVIQAGLKPSILLPQPPECWDYRLAPPHLASYFLLLW